MMETSGLSHWLTSLLKPAAAPAPVSPAPAPVAFAPAEAAPGAPAAPAPHPNLVVLYDRARAREAALQQERAAMEPKVMAAFGVLGLLLVGATVATEGLAWGLSQWQSPWRVALVAVPNVVAVACLVRWAWDARRAVGELLAERKFPFAGHQALVDPLVCLGKDADGWLTGMIQDVHASNNAHDLSLRKQHERLQALVGGLTRLGVLLLVVSGYDAVWRQQAPVAAAPAPAPVASAAPAAIAPTVAPSPDASPVAARPAWPIRPSAAAPTVRAVAPVASPAAAAPRRALVAPRVQPTVAPRARLAEPVTAPAAVATAQPVATTAPAQPPRAAAPTPAAPAAPAAEKKPAVPAEKKPAAVTDEPAPAAPSQP
jgi:hypothetical protein